MANTSQDTIYFILHKILHLEKLEDRIFDLENKNCELEVDLKILRGKFEESILAVQSQNNEKSSNEIVNFDKESTNELENVMKFEVDEEFSTVNNEFSDMPVLENELENEKLFVNVWTSESDPENPQDRPAEGFKSEDSESDSQNHLLKLSLLQNLVIHLTRVDTIAYNKIKKRKLKKVDRVLKKKKSVDQIKKKSYYSFCHICSKSFAYLSQHLRVHTGERPFKCKICPKSFQTISNLKAHNRIHTGEKPFICTKCPAKFAMHASLKAHKLIHMDIKPYKCIFCAKLFRYKSNLVSHTKVYCKKAKLLAKSDI